MSRPHNRLTARQVAAITTPGRHGDGLGLWLQVSTYGSKAWLFRFVRDGRERQMGLGSIHSVSLAEARRAARAARQLLIAGLDPIEARRKRRDRDADDVRRRRESEARP